MNLALRYYAFVVAVLVLSACGGEAPPEPKVGMRVDEHPTTTAILFFESIYNTSNIEQAARLSSPKLARVIRHYNSSSAVQRHLIGMQFDPGVEMKEDREGKAYRETFADDATVTLKFKGTLRGEKREDIRSIALKKTRGYWRVVEIKADTFI